MPAIMTCSPYSRVQTYSSLCKAFIVITLFVTYHLSECVYCAYVKYEEYISAWYATAIEAEKQQDSRAAVKPHG